MRAAVRRVLLGMAAGLVSGSLVGLVEALYVLTSGSPAEYVALVYAAVLYALAGVVAGAGCGGVLALVGLVRPRLDEAWTYTLCFVGVLCSLGPVIFRFIVERRVYQEQGVPLRGDLVIGAVFSTVFLLGLWLGPILLTRTPFKILLRSRGTLALYGVMLLLAAVFSLSPADTGPPTDVLSPERPVMRELTSAPDVVLLMVDALRADHVGAYGAPGDPTPNLDELARQGVLFEQAIAPSSWTRASTASLFTSTPPRVHTCQPKAAVLPGELVTLAEVLQAHGLVTGGLPNNINITRSFNFQQGFDYFSYQAPHYLFGATETASQLSLYQALRRLRDRAAGGRRRVEDHYRPAEQVLAEARRFIEANEHQRWFLFAHLMEPHDPYFARPLDGTAFARSENPDPDPARAEELRALYTGEIRHVDARIGAFVDWLDARAPDTLLVILSDHGEEFYEHGGWWHGTTLYEEQIRLPLIVRLPGRRWAGTRIPWQVRLEDVPVTVVDWLGLPAPETWEGRTLFDEAFQARVSAEGTASEEGQGSPGEGSDERSWASHPASRLAVAEQNLEGNVVAAIRKGGWKLQRANPGNPRGLAEVELYDLRKDPGEQNDLAGQGLEMEGRLLRDLRVWMERASRRAVGAQRSEVDHATANRLEALGYEE